jgi:hypothetical protein
MRITNAVEARSLSLKFNREELERQLGILSRRIRREARCGQRSLKCKGQIDSITILALNDRGYRISPNPNYTLISW